MIDNCYTFKELCQKYNWNTTMASIDGQIKFALARGVEIEVAFKKALHIFVLLERLNFILLRNYVINIIEEIILISN